MRRWRFLVFGLALGLGGFVRGEEGTGLVVHEWGVMVRQGMDSGMLGAADALLGSLPEFVGKHATAYKPQPMIQVFRKPVLHFYGAPQDVSVRVMTPTGRPLAYWPMPRYIEGQGRRGVGVNGMMEAVGVHWDLKLTRAKPEGVQRVPEDHWWAKIREVDSLWVETLPATVEGQVPIKTGAEKFLFYEGTGLAEPAVAGRMEGDLLVLENKDAKATGPVLVIVNNGEERYLEVVKEIGAGESVGVEREEMLATPVDMEAIREAAEEQWLSYGMTAEEASMIVSVWEEDLWETKGFLVISRIPSAIYDEKIFPITITPTPDELVRAVVVFDTLPGVEGKLGWLGAVGEDLERLVGELGGADPRGREEATVTLAEYGDLAVEVLKKGMLSEDPETRMRVERLLGKLKGKPEEPVGEGVFVPGKGGVLLEW